MSYCVFEKKIELCYVVLFICLMIASLPVLATEIKNECDIHNLTYPAETIVNNEILRKYLKIDRNNSRNSTILIEFLPAHFNEHSETKKYLDVISNLTDLYPNFSVCIVLQPNTNKISTIDIAYYNKHNKVNIVIDSLNISKIFGVEKNCYFAMILNDESKVKFVTDRTISYDLLRRIISTYGGDKIIDLIKRDTLLKTFNVSNHIHNIEIRDFNTDSISNLLNFSNVSTTCVIFGAACTKCQIREFMQKLGRIQTKLSVIEKGNIICLIEGQLEREDIQEYLLYYDISIPTFITYHFMDTPNRFFETEDDEMVFLVVRWDDNGMIYYSNSYEQFNKTLD